MKIKTILATAALVAMNPSASAALVLSGTQAPQLTGLVFVAPANYNGGAVSISANFSNVSQQFNATTGLLSGSGLISAVGPTANGALPAPYCAQSSFANTFCKVYFTYSGFTLNNSAAIPGVFAQYTFSGGSVQIFVDNVDDGLDNGKLWLSGTGFNQFSSQGLGGPLNSSLLVTDFAQQPSILGTAAFDFASGGSGFNNKVSNNSGADFNTSLTFDKSACMPPSLATGQIQSQSCTQGSGNLTQFSLANLTPYTPPAPPAPPVAPIVNPIPTPVTLALFGSGLLGLAAVRRRANK